MCNKLRKIQSTAAMSDELPVLRPSIEEFLNFKEFIRDEEAKGINHLYGAVKVHFSCNFNSFEHVCLSYELNRI